MLIENDLLRFVLGHILIITAIVILCVVVWIVDSIVVYLFASAVEYQNSLLAWIPVGIFKFGVIEASLATASGSSTSVGFVVFLSIFTIPIILGWVPVVGLLFSIIYVVAFIITFILMIKDMYVFCQAFNKSFILSILCWFLIPVLGRLIVLNGFRRAYVRETEGL